MQFKEADVFYWSDGVQIVGNIWRKGEPSLAVNELCARLQYEDGKRALMDIYCKARFRFICQRNCTGKIE